MPNVEVKFKKKAYNESTDSGNGIIVFDTTNNKIYVGGVCYSSNVADASYSNGTLTITKRDGTSQDVIVPNMLGSFEDVTITNPTSGQSLVYNGTSWVNQNISVELAENVTYSQLVSKIAANNGAGSLETGKLYRITDFVTTTRNGENPDITDGNITYKSAMHPFDLIVMATSSNKLDYQAKAILHSGDTYFSNEDLSKWQIWYDINNDTKYWWGDSTNGKGIIYRMIDEYNNDCPYDFKNILFKRKLKNGSYDPTNGTLTWVYTFGGTNGLFTMDDFISNNIIKDNNDDFGYGVVYTLPNNVFLGVRCDFNTLGSNCLDNTFGVDCSGNTFGAGCMSNTFGNGCHNNTFGNACYNNTFGNHCESNTFGDNCENNTFGDLNKQNGNWIKYVTIESGNNHIRLYNSSTANDSHRLQNIYITQGVNNLDISTIARNLNYRTTVARLSDGAIRIYREDEDDMNFQPDWNQNDPTAPDYVKNRTHWEEQSNITHNVTNYRQGEDIDSGKIYINNPFDDCDFLFTAQNIIVSINNYNFNINNGNSSGNNVIFENNDCKLTYTRTDNGNQISRNLDIIVSNSVGWPIESVIITVADSNIHQLDSKYIPDLPLTKISDVPSITNNGGKILAVNSGATGVEWVTPAYETQTNKVTSLSAQSTDTQYPSAKCVYDLIGPIDSALDAILNGSSN